MKKQLVQKQLIIPKKSFKQELDKLLLSVNLPKYNNRKGNKQFTTKQKLAVVILYFRSQKSLRQFCEEFEETKWGIWLELKYKVKRSTISDWIKLFDLDFIKSLIEKTNKNSKSKVVAIDGTGIDTDFKSSYFQKRLNDFGKKQKFNYHKLDIICDVKTNKILDFLFLFKQRHDSYVAKKLFKRRKFKLKNKIILADKGYCDYNFENLVGETNHFISPPRKNEGGEHNRLKSKRKKDLFNKFKQFYSLRNNVESVFSTLKRNLFERIRSKSSKSKRREINYKILLYNISCEIRNSTLFFFRNLLHKFLNF